MLRTLEAISTYLNLVSDILRSSRNWEFLTGTSTACGFTPAASANQETQCLSFGSTFWIANNDDVDSDVQKRYLEAVGVSTAEDLRRHVAKYAKRALKFHGTTMRQTHQRSPGEKFLYALGGVTDGSDRGDVLAVLPRNGVIASYALGTVTKTEAPPVAQVVVVTGDYDGTGGSAMHAEQKLVAALGRSIRQYPGTFGIKVAGLKRPCGTCSPVLAAVKKKLEDRSPSVDLDYGSSIGSARDGTGLGVDTPPGIRTLNVDAYYT
jgi:hypothetical protein